MNSISYLSLLKSRKLLLALLVLDWLFAGSTNATTHEPGFTGPITNVTAPLGREAILACTVHNLSTYKVAWLRVDTQTILTIHTHVISRSRRVGVTHSDHRTWFLHIRELRETDRGWYMCQINTDPMKSQLGFLDVVIPPDILDRGTSRDQTVREGASVSLTCAATGSPQPQIIWRREASKPITLSDGMQVSSLEGPVLNISRVSRQHAGAYLCIASNGVPPTLSKRIMLTVEFPPVITIRNQLVGAAIGSDLVLECDTEAYPKPVSYWSRENGEIVPVNGGLEPQKFDGAFRSVLRLPIRRVTSSDYGAYKCVSKNALGDTEGTIKLYPMPQPALDSKNVLGARPGSRRFRQIEFDDDDVQRREQRSFPTKLRRSGGKRYRRRISDCLTTTTIVTTNKMPKDVRRQSRQAGLDEVEQRSRSSGTLLHLTEDLIPKFTGQDKTYPAARWIEDVEDNAEVFAWTPVQQLLMARRSLSGTAALWLRAEKTFKTWDELKAGILKEFPDTVDTKTIHELMNSRTKKHDESYLDYLLVMKVLGKRGKMPDYVAMYLTSLKAFKTHQLTR